MATFTAHYYSPKSNAEPINGLFDFDSENRMGSKALEKDARLAMLSRFGNSALTWNIDKISKKKKRAGQTDGQMMLDFREAPQKSNRKKKKAWW